ncbi:thioredoxin domain-containing protein 17-like [Ischnura elegans]|uniref:thioredoxin domain-containing protein 17-like n=1 Tax=Ischnura elegans TaxID=197161 RepID=UPI001ED89C47|nr:thioredoxin domain-containing protein 17-like [Ischnura elegans]
MVVKRAVEGFDEFNKAIKELESSSKTILVLFSGSKGNAEKSWCPDCVTAEPVINSVLNTLDDSVQFLYVGVGDRDTWKNPNCVFRKDERLRLSSVPTLVRWGQPQQLEEEKCCNPDLIRLLLEDN